MGDYNEVCMYVNYVCIEADKVVYYVISYNIVLVSEHATALLLATNTHKTCTSF